ncbi:MAG: FAD-binding oxidoreductase [Bacteroidota bacterium]
MSISHDAIIALQEIVGIGYVKVDEDSLAYISQATFPTTQKVTSIVYPANTEQVAACVKLANQHKFTLYPVSQGKNWGLGSKLPLNDGAVVLDLQRMNAISDFSEEMAYVSVAPGVTFQQLFEFLEENESGLMMDGIGSTPFASIVGNTVERGHGLALLADRFDHVCGMEVVLPTGEVINTGYQRYQGSEIGNLAKWGLGPYVDGLFTQSNLGIVTKLTLFLRPKAAYFQSFLFHIDNNKQLPVLINKLREMRLNGFQMSLRIFNDYRWIAFFQQYPWESESKTPLSKDKRKALRKEYGNLGKWIGLGGLYSLDPEHGKAERKYMQRQLDGLVDRMEFLTEEKVAKALKKAKKRKDEREVNRLKFMFTNSVLRGYTSQAAVTMCYWRKKDEAPEMKDIHRDKCGVLWYCPAVPNRGKDVRQAVEIVERVSKKYGFEPNIGFLFISDRALDITGALCYDREQPGEDERAMQCHDELMLEYFKLGYTPYRLGIQSMHYTQKMEESSKDFLKQLKSTLDPNHVLSPGRYIP